VFVASEPYSTDCACTIRTLDVSLPPPYPPSEGDVELAIEASVAAESPASQERRVKTEPHSPGQVVRTGILCAGDGLVTVDNHDPRTLQ
jgi:hypothetical protein